MATSKHKTTQSPVAGAMPATAPNRRRGLGVIDESDPRYRLASRRDEFSSFVRSRPEVVFPDDAVTRIVQFLALTDEQQHQWLYSANNQFQLSLIDVLDGLALELEKSKSSKAGVLAPTDIDRLGKISRHARRLAKEIVALQHLGILIAPEGTSRDLLAIEKRAGGLADAFTLSRSDQTFFEPGNPGKEAERRTIGQLGLLFFVTTGKAPTASRWRRKSVDPPDYLAVAGEAGQFVAQFFRELRKIFPHAAEGVTAATIETDIGGWQAMYKELSPFV